MTTAAEVLIETAREAAESVQQRIAALELEIAEIEKKKAEIEAKRMALSGALERFANYPIALREAHFCPLCWVDDDKKSIMKPTSSETSDDISQCRLCHYRANLGSG